VSQSRWIAQVEITQECEGEVSIKEVEDWLAKQFEGCDLGSVKVLDVSGATKLSDEDVAWFYALCSQFSSLQLVPDEETTPEREQRITELAV